METTKLSVSVLDYTVADAVASLTRLRVRTNGPFLLERPRSPLVVENTDVVIDGDHILLTVRVTCDSWQGTVLTLQLTSSKTDRSDWLAWGDVTITYGTTHYPALSGTTIRRRIGPSFETKVDWAPMRYRVRVPVSR